MSEDTVPTVRPSAVVRILGALIVFCMVCMVVLVFGNVVLRYVFNSGISISEELSRMLFVWMTFIGAIVAVAEGAHLGMDSVVSRLPKSGKLLFALLSDAAIIVCCVLLAQGAWTQTILNMGNVAPVSGIPLGYVHVSVLVASVGIVLIVSGRSWRLLTGRSNTAPGTGDMR
jgi:TRAP-type C4-dicarboxylate transport system permease small subunit